MKKRKKKKESRDNKSKGLGFRVTCHFTFKNILRQKKNYGNSNISSCKNTIFKKSSKKKTYKPIITLL